MFWALEVNPAKVYKQKVAKSYHISMACLQPSKCTDSNYTTLVCKKDGSDFVLCNLHKDKIVQVQLDLMFGPGDEIAFSLVGGKNKVYLSGYVVDDDEIFEGSDSEEDSTLQQDVKNTLKAGKRKLEATPTENSNKKIKSSIEQSDDDSEESDEDEEDDGGYEQDEEDNEEDDDEEDDEDEDEDEEASDSGSESDDELESDEESTPMRAAQVKSPEKAKKKTPNAKQQINEKMQQKTPAMTPDPQVNGKLPNSKKKKGNKTPGGDENFSTPKQQKTPDSSKESTPQKMKLEGGVMAIDTKVGSGPPAKPGRKVAVYYTGRLQQNGKQFDSTTQGKGFVFQLGRGEVIKGWDIGVAGMKVGGKRKITVPAAMAYGSKGSPPVIPPNANLVFEVELKNIY